MDVQCRVPRARDEDIVLSVVENGLDACAVGGEYRLVACGEIDTVTRVSRIVCKDYSSFYSSPSDIPIQPCGICLFVILPKAHV